MNRALFSTLPKAPVTDTLNDAGGRAYLREPREALEQYALTGCFNGTFYVDAQEHLTRVLDLCKQVADVKFIADLAVTARENGLMKDMPVFLLAYVATRDIDGTVFKEAFPRCVDGVKQLSKFVRVVRSGILGRKSLGSRITKTIEHWLDAQEDERLWWGSVGVADPSLADIVRLVHPKPKTPARAALYGYLSGRNKDENAIERSMLPAPLRAWEAYTEGPLPNVPFQLLVGRSDVDWKLVAERSSWAQARQSLNTFGKHGCWKDTGLVDRLAAKLAAPPERVMPYQILTTYQNIDDGTPRPIVNALHEAMEKACANVPLVPARTLIAVDISGSMQHAITGVRKGSTSKTRCVDVAALFACALLRKQPNATVVFFDTQLYASKLEPRDTILTNAKIIASKPGGGTDCSLPMRWALTQPTYDLIVYVSDNESWVDGGGMTAQLWAEYARRNKQTKLVCIDLTPNKTAQVKTQERVWNIGGFSDIVFELIGRIAT